MILRLIRGRAGRAELEALRAALARTLGPDAAEAAGPAHWHMGTRGEGEELELLIMSTWATAEAAARGDARSISPLRLAQAHLTRVDVEHFEIDDSLQRRSGLDPIAIRVATGRFSHHGTDIEMQDLLRERMPTIGDEMCEAYVGRRLDGLAVEVTFVSLWQRLPGDRALEDPMWPDIALRYDSFAVEVYAAVR